MKRVALLLAAALAAGSAATALASGKTASLVINHVRRGCHVWSLDGGPARTHQVARLARGGSLLVTNDDLMIQDLIKTGGPAVRMRIVRQSHMGSGMRMGMRPESTPTRYAMSHMGAQLRVTFPVTGTYRFKLVDRGDYFEGIATVGPDNELTLTVVVS